MPLVVATLTSALTAVFQSYPPTAAQCADGMATAYVSYAAAGMFAACTITISPTAKDALKEILLGAIASPLSGSPATFASAWVSGLSALWTPANVTVTPTPPVASGAVTGCPGAGAAQAPISAACANLTNTAPQFAQQLATALDTATKTVLAGLITPPSPTPVPTPLT